MADIKIYAKPSNLYRYRPLGKKADRELKGLLEGFIYCPPYSKLNDPMEGKHRLSKRFLENPGSSKRQTRIQHAFEAMGVASFSETYDHEPMWAHYAQQFEGMCVEYNMGRLLSGLDDTVALTRMMYSENEPVLLNDGSKASDRARLCLSNKTARWASEREWRVFIDETGPAKYQDLKTVTKVFLGSRVSPDDEARVCVAARQLNIPVSKMSIEAYSLAFKTLQPAVRPRPH